MQVLLAGAGGAVGIPLTRMLVAAGHDVVAVTRSQAAAQRLRELSVTPVVTDVLDRDALLRALEGRPLDAVISQLTALKKPPLRARDMQPTNELRTRGTANLLAAARATGARRFVTQSMMFGYGYGDHGRILTEDDAFGTQTNGRFRDAVIAMRDNEAQVLGADGIEGTALRYGLFYGVGASGDVLVDGLRKRRMPVLRDARPLSWVYVDDAAAAAVAALERGVGGEAYNIADDEPVSWTTMMRALATALGAPAPRVVPGWLLTPMPYARSAMSGGVALSNDKARTALGWKPSVPTYRDGARRFAEEYARA